MTLHTVVVLQNFVLPVMGIICITDSVCFIHGHNSFVCTVIPLYRTDCHKSITCLYICLYIVDHSCLTDRNSRINSKCNCKHLSNHTWLH